MTENRMKFQKGLIELQQAFNAQFPEPKLEKSRIAGLINAIKLKRRVKILNELLEYINSWGPDLEKRLDSPEGPRAEDLLEKQWNILAKAGVKR